MKLHITVLTLLFSASSAAQQMDLCKNQSTEYAELWSSFELSVTSTKNTMLYSLPDQPPDCVTPQCKAKGPGAPVPAGQRLAIIDQFRQEDPYGRTIYTFCVRTSKGNSGWVSAAAVDFSKLDEPGQSILEDAIVSVHYEAKLTEDEGCSVNAMKARASAAEAFVKAWPRVPARSRVALEGSLALIDGATLADTKDQKLLWERATALASLIDVKLIKDKSLATQVLQAVLQRKPIPGRQPNCNDHL